MSVLLNSVANNKQQQQKEHRRRQYNGNNCNSNNKHYPAWQESWCSEAGVVKCSGWWWRWLRYQLHLTMMRRRRRKKSTLPCYVSCSILNNIMLRISKCHVLFCFSFVLLLLLLLMLGAYEWLKLFSLLSASLLQHCLTWVTVVCEWCSRSCWDCCCCCVVIIIISHV